jgi:heme-degrading monooxygenase HmoA
MFAVIFEVHPTPDGMQRYLDLAAHLRSHVEAVPGFLSIERWRCLTRPGWILSLSLWQDEAALVRWRAYPAHHCAQAAGRGGIFADYRLRVGQCASDDERDAPRRMPERRTAYNDPSRPPRFVGIAIEDARPRETASSDALYESIVNAGRHATVTELPSEMAGCERWRDGALTRSPRRVMITEIERDYGMFDRAEAPQYFPPV